MVVTQLRLQYTNSSKLIPQTKNEESCVGFWSNSVECCPPFASPSFRMRSYVRQVNVSVVETERDEMEDEEGLQAALLMVSLNDVVARLSVY